MTIPKQISAYLAANGRKGGKAGQGAAKRRSGLAAALVRWGPPEDRAQRKAERAAAKKAKVSR